MSSRSLRQGATFKQGGNLALLLFNTEHQVGSRSTSVKGFGLAQHRMKLEYIVLNANALCTDQKYFKEFVKFIVVLH